jgi:hypothetical protein
MEALRLCHEFPLGRDCFRAMLELPESARCLEEPLWNLAKQVPPASCSSYEHCTDQHAATTTTATTAAAAAAASEDCAKDAAEPPQMDQEVKEGSLTFSQLMVFAWRVCKADADQRSELFWTLFGAEATSAKHVHAHAVTLSTQEVRAYSPVYSVL